MIEEQNPDADVPAEARLRVRRTFRSQQDRNQRLRRLVTYALFVGSAVLMVNALVGENGYLATVRARRERAALSSSLATIRLTNQELKEKIRRLKEDPNAVEEAARRDLGLIRPGETLVIIHDARPHEPASVPR